jgi:hypothetical protein
VRAATIPRARLRPEAVVDISRDGGSIVLGHTLCVDGGDVIQ